MKITPRKKIATRENRLFLRGVIFTRARVSLALLSLRKMGTTRSLLLTCLRVIYGVFFLSPDNVSHS